RKRFHVQAAVAITQSRSTPVLLTVPCTVMASPKAARSPLKTSSFRAGFEVRISCAMDAPIVLFILAQRRKPKALATNFANEHEFDVGKGTCLSLTTNENKIHVSRLNQAKPDSCSFGAIRG